MSGLTNYLGDEFGQRVDLCVRIREVLSAYPESSTARELLQNADDAGARSFSLCLDLRAHPSAQMAYPGLASLQGPALIAFNDATFTEADWASIQRIGDSLKREESGGLKTGRLVKSPRPTTCSDKGAYQYLHDGLL